MSKPLKLMITFLKHRIIRSQKEELMRTLDTSYKQNKLQTQNLPLFNSPLFLHPMFVRYPFIISDPYPPKAKNSCILFCSEICLIQAAQKSGQCTLLPYYNLQPTEQKGALVQKHRFDSFLSLAVNPEHQIHVQIRNNSTSKRAASELGMFQCHTCPQYQVQQCSFLIPILGS